MEGRLNYTEMSKVIDQRFPISTLVQWADEVTNVGRLEDHDAQANINSLREDDFFKENIYPVLMELIHKPDLKINSGNKDGIEILHGSDFYPKAFSLLNDQEVNRALDEYSDCFRESVPRSRFNLIFMLAASATHLLFGIHQFDPQTVNQIVKQSLSSAIYEDYQTAGDFHESTFIFYGCLKVWANKLSRTA